METIKLLLIEDDWFIAKLSSPLNINRQRK